MVDGVCSCGADPLPGHFVCAECKAESQRRRRAKARESRKSRAEAAGLAKEIEARVSLFEVGIERYRNSQLQELLKLQELVRELAGKVNQF